MRGTEREYITAFTVQADGSITLEFDTLGKSAVREEVVRCKDCMHYVPECGYSEERGFGQIEYLMEPPACARSKAIQITVDPNGFCKWGVRRDA